MNVETATPRPIRRRDLPTPPLAAGGVPAIGHALALIRDPLSFLTRLRDRGDLVRIKLGPKTVYAVATPELVGAMLKSPHYKVGGPLWESLEALLGKGVATSNGSKHRRQRRTIQPAFRLDLMPEYATVMEQEARALADRWKPGDTVDATTESFRIAVRITARCLLRGESMDERAERLCTSLTTVFRGMYQRMVLPAGPLYRLPLPANRRFDRALADLHRLVDEIIAERRTSGEKSDDLLTALLEAKDENNEPISEQEIHDQVVAIIIPGSETIASTLLWIFHVLAEHPEHATRISEEVKSVAASRPIAFDDLKSLSHLYRVLVEAIRLHPAVWIITRQAATDTELGGYHIPAGTDVVYSPYAMQRDPRSYDRHLEFDPDRWLPERSGDVSQRAMIPFSTGNRKCPGDHFSMALVAIVTATVAQRWRFHQLPQSDDSVRVGITLRPKRLILRAIPRYQR